MIRHPGKVKVLCSKKYDKLLTCIGTLQLFISCDSSSLHAVFSLINISIVLILALNVSKSSSNKMLSLSAQV